MISHLSFPEGSSINDGIEQTFCSVRYTSFDKVTDMIYDLGVGALLAKRDLKSAYRILPIRVEDFPLLGIKAGDKYYIDKFLPMGLSQSANLFEKFSTFLQWLVEKRSGMTTVDHLLDDFIFAGKHGSNACMSLVNTFEEVCKELGVPIATEKSIDPTTVMVFLGLEIDTNEMPIRVPSHKIEELTALLQDFLSRKKITLKQLQSLVGKLNFFSKAIRSSRAFLRRFYDAMLPLKKPHNFIRVAGEIKEDFRVWLDFLKHFNGVAYIPQHVWFSNEQLQLFTDSAGSVHLGAGCFFEGNWCFFPWPKEWAKTEVHKDLTFLEMVPVILTLYLWGGRLANKKVTFNVDNEALVAVLNRQTSKSRRLMQLVRPFVLLSMRYGIVFRAVHIGSKSNAIADSISRQQWARFRRLAPEAVRGPERLPSGFLQLISNMKLQNC